MSGHRIEGVRGTIEITGAALTQLVVQAAESARGARVRRPRRGLEVEVEDGRARIELELAVAFGVVVPDVAREVQGRVAEALEGMCGLAVDAIDISVEELDG